MGCDHISFAGPTSQLYTRSCTKNGLKIGLEDVPPAPQSTAAVPATARGSGARTLKPRDKCMEAHTRARPVLDMPNLKRLVV